MSSARFTYPFRYVPSPEIRRAAHSLIERIGSDESQRPLFAEGKMLGVLQTDAGFLYAFSGLAGGRAVIDGFVPPIYDYTDPEGYFRKTEARISAMPDGEQKSFSLDNLPDSTWTYVSTETVRDNAAGEVNPSLSFTDADGGYRDYLAASGKVLVLSIYDMEAVPERRWEALADIIPMAFDAGYYPLVLFSGDYASAASYIGARLDADAARIILDSSYFADRKTIMTLNRSNGGATYFHDGYLVRKWASRNLPSENDLARIALDYVDEAVVETTTAGHIGFQAFLVGTFAVILFV